MRSDFTIRRLAKTDWTSFREIRLEALQRHPHVYSSSFVKEKDYTQDTWSHILESPNGAIFGCFLDDKQLVGISAIFDKDEKKAALLCMWYMQESLRGQGLFESLVQATLDWARENSTYNRVLVSHRAGNEASRKSNQKFGFRYQYTEPHLWADGQEDDHLFYDLILKKGKNHGNKKPDFD